MKFTKRGRDSKQKTNVKGKAGTKRTNTKPRCEILAVVEPLEFIAPGNVF